MSAEVVKLMPGDLDELDRLQERPSAIKRIRDHHHLIARLVAEGKRTTDIANEVGLSISRVSILKGDPTFKQLVEMYRMNYNQLADAAYADVKKKAAILEMESIEHRLDQYYEDPDSISAAEARADGAWARSIIDSDRIGKSVSVHGNLNDLQRMGMADLFEYQSKRADEMMAEVQKRIEKKDD